MRDEQKKPVEAEEQRTEDDKEKKPKLALGDLEVAEHAEVKGGGCYDTQEAESRLEQQEAAAKLAESVEIANELQSTARGLINTIINAFPRKS